MPLASAFRWAVTCHPRRSPGEFGTKNAALVPSRVWWWLRIPQ